MLQDAIWADAGRLADDPEYRDAAVRFVAASLQGWAFCRDNVEQCATIVTDAGSTLGASHQQWMMNEVNKLIWPASGASIGLIDQAAWDQTVEISQNTPNLEGATVLTADPGRRCVHERHRDRGGGPARRGRPRRQRLQPDRGHPERGRQLITPTA